MNTKLDTITTQYRKFNANQALNEGQLNEFIDYFEDQDRLSRTRLSGVGIACGFSTNTLSYSRKIAVDTPDFPVQNFNAISITQGIGVTTDGDLITLRRKDYDSDGMIIDLPSVNYTYYREYVDTLSYPHFMNGDQQMPLLELYTEQEYEDLSSVIKDKNAFHHVSTIPKLQNKIVILYLESYSNDDTPCEDADCDNNGAEQVSNLKVLLADKTDVETYMVKKDSIYTVHNDYEVLYDKLKDIEARRVILNADVTTELGLQLQFEDAIQSPAIIATLIEGFSDIAKTFGIGMNFSGQSLADRLGQLLKTSSVDYQYRYDLLKDLIDTYNEIRELVLHLKSVCCPTINSFPKHLMLGPVGAALALGDHTDLRHDFYNSPINTDADENQQKLLLLANRFVLKINNFQTYSGPIKITPSNLNVALGKKAVPFYYDVNKDLLENWDFEKTQTDKSAYNLSYHTGNLSIVDFIQQPLLYSIADNDFYRIEGHLGMPYKIALQNINDLISKYGLNFKVQALALRKVKSSGGVKKAALAVEPSTISIKELRDKLISISSDISNQAGNTQKTLQTISGLDNQLRLLNAVDFAPSQSGVSVVRQNPKEADVVSELLSEFLERNSGLEHMAGVEKPGTFFLIYGDEDNNQVIADFSMPYLCCTKKDPVFLVLPAAKLCQNDPQIPITIIPLDGDIKAYVDDKEITAITQSGGQNFFNPSLVSTQYLGKKITFTVNDDAVDTEIVVHAQPNVTVLVDEPIYGEDPDVPEANVVFNINTNGVTGLTYSINYGDGKSESGAIPSGGKIQHMYKLVAGQEDIFKPILSITNLNGCIQNYTLKPLTLVGQSTVQCLSSMEIIVQYHQSKGPCPGGHTCNSAKFNLMANTVNIGLVNLNNASNALQPGQNYPVGETSGPNRMNSFEITPAQAQLIVDGSSPNDGFISFSLVCAESSCHTGVAWTTLKLDGLVIYNGCPTNNFLTINPCTGEVRS